MPGAIGLGQQAMDFLQREGRTVVDQGPTPDMLQDATRHRARKPPTSAVARAFAAFKVNNSASPGPAPINNTLWDGWSGKVSGSDASSEGPLSRALW